MVNLWSTWVNVHHPAVTPGTVARCFVMEDIPGVPTHRDFGSVSGAKVPAAASSTPKRPRHSATQPAAHHSSTIDWNAGFFAVMY